MPPRRTARLLTLPAALAALLAAAPAGFADEPVGTTAKGSAIVADAGYAAWRAGDGHVVIRAGDGPARVTSLRPPAGAILDVGVRAGGGGQLIYTEGCSTRSASCAVRSATLTSATVAAGSLPTRVIARIPYRGGGSPAVAIDGSRLAYAVHGATGSGTTRSACDVPYLRTLSSRDSSTSTRRLDRGHCAAISQLDVGEGYVAVLAHPAVRYGSGATEARVVKLAGGRSRTLQREAQGEESNFIGAVSLDGQALYTARGGIRQPNVFTRIRLGSRARADARAFVGLGGAFARDRGRDTYAQTTGTESPGCGDSAAAPPCLVVAGSDPFAAAQRTLAPELSLTVAPQPVFVDTKPSAIATLTRRTVSQSAVVGTAPVPGVSVELLSAAGLAVDTSEPSPFTPTGATATTGADGVATIAIPGTPRPRLLLGAVTQAGTGGVGAAIPAGMTTNYETFAHMTASTERLADGRLRVTGTIGPALPGRKVRLDRRIERLCDVKGPSPLVTPSQVGLPAGCIDRWTQDPVATAAVSADGGSYTIDATTPAGTYRVSLDFAGGADVYAGETVGFEAP